MRIGYTDPQTVQTAIFDHEAHFFYLCDGHSRQQIKQFEHSGAVAQGSEGKLRDDEGMDHNLTLVETIA